MIGISDLILETPLNAEQRDLVQTLRNSGRILLKLIENVLDLSRIESGKLVAEPTDFDLHGLVNSIMEMFSPQSKKKGLQLRTHFSPETCFLLRGDVQHLRQIIINLVGNAIKFTHEGAVELRVVTLKQDNETTLLRFEVADTGIGILQESQQSIFESFTQANSYITSKYGGTGLGTTISKQLVQFMGGQIGLHSQEGKGSTFWFELPFEKQPESRTLKELPTLSQMMRVVVAGMPANVQATLEASLSGWEVRYDYVNSLDQILALIDANQSSDKRHTVILCQPQLFGNTPRDFAARIWANYSPGNLSLILVDQDISGYSEDALLKMGYACLLKTPLDRSLLFNALHSVISMQPSADDVISFMEHYRHNSSMKRSLRILVAEDNGTNRKIISMILERAGHTVDLAENGEQALDLIESNRYDLAILDMHMPVMNGLEAVRIHRVTARHEPHMPIIILTANATTEARRECEEAGADAFLTKPIDAIKLLNTVVQLSSNFDEEPTAPMPVPDSTQAVITGALLLNERTLHHLNLLGEGSDDFMHSVIHGFISEGEHLIEAMQVALAKQEYVTFKELAHTLKGSAGNVGAEKLFQTCREISQRNLADLQNEAERLLIQSQSNFNEVRQALKRYMETP